MRWYWLLVLLVVAALVATSGGALSAVRRVLPEAGMAPMILWLPFLAAALALTKLFLGTRTVVFLALAAGAGWFLLMPAYTAPLWGTVTSWLASSTLHVDGLTSTVLHNGVSALPVEFTWLLPLALCAMLVAGILAKGVKVE
jgi:hypothetical protein